MYGSFASHTLQKERKDYAGTGQVIAKECNYSTAQLNLYSGTGPACLTLTHQQWTPMIL